MFIGRGHLVLREVINRGLEKKGLAQGIALALVEQVVIPYVVLGEALDLGDRNAQGPLMLRAIVVAILAEAVKVEVVAETPRMLGVTKVHKGVAAVVQPRGFLRRKPQQKVVVSFESLVNPLLASLLVEAIREVPQNESSRSGIVNCRLRVIIGLTSRSIRVSIVWGVAVRRPPRRLRLRRFASPMLVNLPRFHHRPIAGGRRLS
mmetsp:Transcript_41408/g.119185  ORF Transcript_41408/g.119185 Transcript_41408/m.119185 type:complete len:205 (+) Transcript_41408:712-1326(+)